MYSALKDCQELKVVDWGDKTLVESASALNNIRVVIVLGRHTYKVLEQIDEVLK